MIEETWLIPCVNTVLKGRSGDAPTMIDVGANTGDWTGFLRDHFHSIVAYEADARLVPGLAERFAGDENVVVVWQAVGPERGTTTFYQREGESQSSLSPDHPFGHYDVEHETVVPAVTLRDCVGDGADFVKIDIEGGETLLDYPDNVGFYLVECHGTFNEVRSLIPHNYFVFRITHPYKPAARQGHCWLFAAREVPDGLGV